MIRAIVRKFANSSLRREAAKAEREIESLQEEIEEREEKLNAKKQKLDIEYEEKKAYLDNQLQIDQEFLQKIYPMLYMYIHQDMQYKKLKLQKEFFQFKRSQYQQQKEHIEEWVDSIKKDLKQMEELKETLLEQSDYSVHLELACMQNPEIPDANERGIISKLENLKQSYPRTSYDYKSLQKLIDFIKYKSEFSKDLDYIEWVMATKRSAEMRFKQRHREVVKEIKTVAENIKETNQQLSKLKSDYMVPLAVEIRDHWEVPLGQLKYKKEEVQEVINQLDPENRYQEYKSDLRDYISNLDSVRVKIEACYDREIYDELDSLKQKRERIKDQRNRLKEKISTIAPYKKEAYDIRQEIGQWRERRKMIYDQLKELNVYLVGGNQYVSNRLQVK